MAEDTYNRALMAAELDRDEGTRLRPYADTRGKLTVGTGRNLTDVGISEAESFLLLGNDIIRCEMALDAALPWWRALDAVRQRALLNLAFNMGAGGLMTFERFLAAMQARDYATAGSELQSSLWWREVGARGPRVQQMVVHGTVPDEPAPVPRADLPPDTQTQEKPNVA